MAKRTLLLFTIGALFAAWRIPARFEAQFVVAPPVAAPTTASASLRTIDLPAPTPSAHASSIAVERDGTIRVAWFGGAREGAADVGIWIAEVPAGASAPTWHWQVLSRQSLATLTGRVIRSLGNPVLWLGPDGALHLYVVSVSYGGWSGSAVNSLTLDPTGRSVLSARRLILSPLFNLSTLVRAQPLPMSNGLVGLPAYHEFITKSGVWIVLGEDGAVLGTAPLPRSDRWLQPAVAAISADKAVAALRCADGAIARIGLATTEKAGESWALAGATSIPNPNSGVALIRLQDGSLLLAANPLTSGRSTLQLFRSSDDGSTWIASRIIESSVKLSDEFSYPCLAEGSDGTIHLSYTRLRQGIRLLSFGRGWLDAESVP